MAECTGGTAISGVRVFLGENLLRSLQKFVKLLPMHACARHGGVDELPASPMPASHLQCRPPTSPSFGLTFLLAPPSTRHHTQGKKLKVAVYSYPT